MLSIVVFLIISLSLISNECMGAQNSISLAYMVMYDTYSCIPKYMHNYVTLLIYLFIQQIVNECLLLSSVKYVHIYILYIILYT